VKSFIAHHPGAWGKLKSSPQEVEPLEKPLCFLEETLSCLAKFVQRRPTELVFNLDEVGISDWEDRKTKSVLVPRAIAEQAGHDKRNRTLKHDSVIACVSVAGEGLMPSIATSQDTTRVRDQKNSGVRFGTDFILKERLKRYINADIFFEYILTCCFSPISMNSEVLGNSPTKMQFYEWITVRVPSRKRL
jgi:hypothetical protein